MRRHGTVAIVLTLSAASVLAATAVAGACAVGEGAPAAPRSSAPVAPLAASLVQYRSNGTSYIWPGGWTNETTVVVGVGNLWGAAAVNAAGPNQWGQSDVSTWTGVTEVSAGDRHTVGLKADGTVLAVGDNGLGQTNVSEWTEILGVSAGRDHTVGLRGDGSVVATGSDSYGQSDVSSWRLVRDVAAGGSHTVALKYGGTVLATGDNTKGQTNVSSWTNIKQVTAGGSHTVALKNDGRVLATGDNSQGQCSISGWTNIVQISAGETHTVGLKNDGTVVATGDNSEGQCNVSGWTNMMYVEAGAGHTVAVGRNRAAVATGYSTDGRCDVAGWANLAALSAGGWNTVAIEAGSGRAEFEVKPDGSPFTGTDLVSGPLVEASRMSTATVGALAEGGYRWRARIVDGAGGVSDWTECNGGATAFSVDRSTLRASASRSRVSHGGAITIRAFFATTGPIGLPGHDDVVLCSKPAAGGAWTQECTATDAGGGTYEATATCTQNTVLQMQHAGDTLRGPKDSNLLTVYSYASLGQPWTSPTVPRRGRRFYVYGYLKPRHPGFTSLYFYRRVNGRWRFYMRRAARNYDYFGNTRYRLAGVLGHAGYYRVRAYHFDRSHYRTYSSYRMFRVR